MIATDVTPEELLAMPDYPVYELVSGELLEKRMSFKSEFVAGNIAFKLRLFAEGTKAGLALAEVSYQCFDDEPNRVRKPGASFISMDKLPTGEFPDGHCRIVPDLAVEVVSPNDEGYLIETKVSEYLDAGVRLVWVVYPHIRTILVHRADGTTSRFRSDSTITGDDVLVGFSCPISEFFANPRTGR